MKWQTMNLYVYESYQGNRTQAPATEELIKLSLKQYMAENNIPLARPLEQMPIERTNKGKPFISDLGIHFSVSHSDRVWVCLVGDAESGVDIQNKSHKNYEAIAKRFFQPDEQDAIATGGLPTFISIWCRKEAFIKYYGMTIGDTIDWLNVAKEGQLVDEMDHEGQTVVFTDIEVHPDYFCVAATNKREEIWTRKIQTE